MNGSKPSISFFLLITALIILTLVFVFLMAGTINEKTFCFIRVLTVLAGATISLSMSGLVNIGIKNNVQTLAEKVPNITVPWSIAIFVISYLFNPDITQ